jgi:hydroxyacyl-ACP dehydratase HTD2-like protein with hotdog domain
VLAGKCNTSVTAWLFERAFETLPRLVLREPLAVLLQLERANPVRDASARISVENFSALWSPDAQWIVFARGTPIRNLFRRSLNAGAIDEVSTKSPNWQEPMAISPDGTQVVYVEIDPELRRRAWAARQMTCDRSLRLSERSDLASQNP